MVNRLLIGAFFLLSSAGCVGLWQALITPPKIEVDAVRVANLNLSNKSLDVEVDLKVENSNESPLHVDKINYSLNVAESPVISGVFNTPVELKGKTVTKVTIPVVLNLEATKKAVGNYFFNSIDTYDFKAELSSSGITVPIQNKGKIEINK